MSDGITDAYRAERRWREFERHICAIKDYILNPDEFHFKQAIEVATIIDRDEGTKFTEELGNLLPKLMAVDEDIKNSAWAKLLAKSYESMYFDSLKKLSPFKEKIVAFVDYGEGFVTFYGDIEKFFSKSVADKGLKTFDCDKYIVVMPKPKPKDVEVFWTGCGILGVYGPRKSA